MPRIYLCGLPILLLVFSMSAHAAQPLAAAPEPVPSPFVPFADFPCPTSPASPVTPSIVSLVFGTPVPGWTGPAQFAVGWSDGTFTKHFCRDMKTVFASQNLSPEVEGVNTPYTPLESNHRYVLSRDEPCPSWYARLQRDSQRRFWTEAYGADFYDWYMENAVEGAKEIEPASPLPIQLALPGLAITGHRDETYLIDSF